jgi:nucleoside-diphosphate-sugar epimerase
VNAGRTPVIMDTTKAREQLGWRPAYSTQETLRALTE